MGQKKRSISHPDRCYIIDLGSYLNYEKGGDYSEREVPVSEIDSLNWRGSTASGGYVKSGKFQMMTITAVVCGSHDYLNKVKHIVCDSPKELKDVCSYLQRLRGWLDGGEFNPEYAKKIQREKEEYERWKAEQKKKFPHIHYR